MNTPSKPSLEGIQEIFNRLNLPVPRTRSPIITRLEFAKELLLRIDHFDSFPNFSPSPLQVTQLLNALPLAENRKARKLLKVTNHTSNYEFAVTLYSWKRSILALHNIEKLDDVTMAELLQFPSSNSSQAAAQKRLAEKKHFVELGEAWMAQHLPAEAVAAIVARLRKTDEVNP